MYPVPERCPLGQNPPTLHWGRSRTQTRVLPMQPLATTTGSQADYRSPSCCFIVHLSSVRTRVVFSSRTTRRLGRSCGSTRLALQRSCAPEQRHLWPVRRSSSLVNG